MIEIKKSGNTKKKVIKYIFKCNNCGCEWECEREDLKRIYKTLALQNEDGTYKGTGVCDCPECSCENVWYNYREEIINQVL